MRALCVHRLALTLHFSKFLLSSREEFKAVLVLKFREQVTRAHQVLLETLVGTYTGQWHGRPL